MTFVFEAGELPFATVSEDYASRIDGLVRAYDLAHLPVWDRCMLVAVLPVVLQRRQAVAMAVAASLSNATEGRNSNINNNDNNSSSLSEGGDVADAAEDILAVQQQQLQATAHPPERGSASLDPTSHTSAAADATLSDVEVALTIVRQLDELEVVYDSIVSTRQAGRDGGADSASSKQPAKTSEEILMEQLLQERFSSFAPYLRVGDNDDDESGERASEEGDVVDVAMCFSARGESLGIGSAAVFGGHGYHP
jgi:hypothetical protein